MQENLKLGFILLLVSAIAAGVLAVVNDITKPIIAERERLKAIEAYQEIIPEADDFEDFSSDEMKSLRANHPKIEKVVIAKKDGNNLGYLVTSNGGGYGGNITVISGIIDGKIVQIKILKHKETPNIGAKVENPSFQEQFKDMPTDNLINVVTSKKSPNEIEKISGSTVSSKGVVAAVNAALEWHKEAQ